MIARPHLLALLASSALMPAMAAAQAPVLPTGGTVAAGQVTIGTPQAGALAITQTSRNAVINWGDFSVGAGGRVDIAQPGSDAALLNRVSGSAVSTIAGQITANGQVYLVNPNGIVITRTGSVNAAGFVASTLGISDDDFMAGKRTFTGTGGTIANAGTIAIVRGGFAALIGGRVDNAGLILAPLGKVALGSGTLATLDLAGDGFLQVALPADGGAIAMGGRISADGGSVVLAAASARDAARAIVNMTGTIEARGIAGHDGAVTLTGGAVTLAGATIDVSGANGGGTVRIGGDAQGGGMLAHADTLAVDAATTIRADATTQGSGGTVVLWSDAKTSFAGTISARGAGSGDGGTAEVSSKGVLAYAGATDLTGAAFGTLLLDPYNLTIADADDSSQSGFTATGDDSVVAAATLQSALGTANVTVATGSSGGQAGDILVAAPVTWNTASRLTLDAAGSITIAAPIAVTGGGRVALISGNTTPAGLTTTSGGAITFADGQTGQALSVNGTNYTLLRSMADLTRVGSLGMGGAYALAHDLDAGGTTYTQGVVSTYENSPFTGTFEGAGHAIANLTINAPDSAVGLFAAIGSGALVRNLALVGGSVTGGNRTGALAGRSTGDVANVSSSVDVSGNASSIGGLIGAYGQYQTSIGSLTHASSSGTVVARDANSREIGGLVGTALNIISDSSASGDVSGASYVGGLVGFTYAAITGSHATGRATVTYYGVGGLVGAANGDISNSYATGAVSSGSTNGQETAAGGLVGTLYGSVTAAYATGAVSAAGGSLVGGLVGNASGGSIAQVSASGTVTGTNSVGGLIGASSIAVTDAVASGDVRASGNSVGGLVGDSAGDIVGGSASGRVSGYQDVGGLVGRSRAGIAGSQASGDVTGGSSRVGGLVGDTRNDVVRSHASGAVAGADHVGGLIGSTNGGTVAQVYATGAVSATGSDAGGLIGLDGSDGVSEAFATGAVTGTSVVGGLTGESYSNVHDVYATGAVNGGDFVGGLFGYNGGSLTNAYAVGAVRGDTQAGGAIGVDRGSASNVFWNSETSGQSAGTSSGNNPLIGLTTAQMQDLGSYRATYAGFDFLNTWSPPNAVGQNEGSATAYYPELYSLSHVLALTADSATRAYGDANPAAVVTVSGLRAGDALTQAPALVASASVTSDVGSYANSATTAAAAGSAGEAYRVVRDLGTLTIVPRSLAIDGTQITRTYGDANPTDAYTIGGAGLVNGDTIASVAITTPGLGVTANVGSYAYDLRDAAFASGSAGNYAITYTGNSLTVDARPITIVPYSANSYYDGTGRQPNFAYQVGGAGLVNGDALTGALSSDLVGKGVVGTYAITLGTLAAGDNYALGYVPNSWTIMPKPVQAAVVGNARKTYDGTRTATVTLANIGATNGGYYAQSGFLPGDQVAVSLADASAFYAYRDAGTGKTVVVTGVTLSGADARNYAIGTFGYGQFQAGLLRGDIGTITPKALRIAAASDGKVYDATTLSNVLPTVTGLVAGDSIGGLGQAFDSANAGVRTLAVTDGFTLNDGNNGGNYTVTVASRAAKITPAALTLTAQSDTRSYDGTVDSSVAPLVSGLKGADSIGGLTQAFTSANAGVRTLKVATSYTLNDGNGGLNYKVALQSATGQILQRVISVTLLGTVAKTYDATAIAKLDSSNYAFTNLVGSDAPTLGYVASYDSANAGMSKLITLSSLSLRGSGSSNYTLGLSSLSAAIGTITPRLLKITATGANKTFDGTTTAFATPRITGLIGGDSVAGLGESYDGAGVGSHAITLDQGYTIQDGNNGGNYTVVTTAAKGKITG